jgi:hypothetical protein
MPKRNNWYIGVSFMSALIFAASLYLAVAPIFVNLKNRMPWLFPFISAICGLIFCGLVLSGWILEIKEAKRLEDNYNDIHKKKLIAIMDEYEKDIYVVPIKDQDMILHWLKAEYPTRLNQGDAKLDKDLFIFNFDIEKVHPEWDYLKQHLCGHSALQAFDNWKLAIGQDLTARKQLLDAISKKVRTKENNLDIPIIDSYSSGEPKKPYLTFQYIKIVYDQIFQKVILGDSFNYLIKADELITHGDVVYYTGSGTPIYCNEDSKERDNAIKMLLNFQTVFIELSQAKNCKQSYDKAKSETINCLMEFKEITLSGYLHGECDIEIAEMRKRGRLK